MRRPLPPSYVTNTCTITTHACADDPNAQFLSWKHQHRAYILSKACAQGKNDYWVAYELGGWFATDSDPVDVNGDLVHHVYEAEAVAEAHKFMEDRLREHKVQVDAGASFNEMCRLLSGKGGLLLVTLAAVALLVYCAQPSAPSSKKVG